MIHRNWRRVHLHPVALLATLLALSGSGPVAAGAFFEAALSDTTLNSEVGLLFEVADQGSHDGPCWRSDSRSVCIERADPEGWERFSVKINSTDRLTIRLQLHASSAGQPGTPAAYFYGQQNLYTSTDGQPALIQRGTGHATTAAVIVLRHWLVNVASTDPATEFAQLEDGTFVIRSTTAQINVTVRPQTPPHSDHTASLSYAGLWAPLRWLSKGIEQVMAAVSTLTGSVGIAVIVCALVLRVVLFKLNAWGTRKHLQFEEKQKLIAPEIRRIKQQSKGAEQSQAIVDLYAEHGITPASGLLGSVPLLALLPVLIAVFSVTTESTLFAGASFLWMADLAQPDALFALPASVYGLGSTFNLLPLVLGATLLIGSVARSGCSVGAMAMSGLVALLFYSFASALLLFWVVTYVCQVVEFQWAQGRS